MAAPQYFDNFSVQWTIVSFQLRNISLQLSAVEFADSQAMQYLLFYQPPIFLKVFLLAVKYHYCLRKQKNSIASAELLHPNRTAVAQKTCTHVINALIQKMKSVDNLELITYTFYIFQLD